MRGFWGKAPIKFSEDTPSILAQNTSPDPMFADSKNAFSPCCSRFFINWHLQDKFHGMI